MNSRRVFTGDDPANFTETDQEETRQESVSPRRRRLTDPVFTQLQEDWSFREVSLNDEE